MRALLGLGRLKGRLGCAAGQMASFHGARHSDASSASGLAAIAAAAAAASALMAARERQAERNPRSSWLHCEDVPQFMAGAAAPVKLPPGGKLVLSADCGGTTTRLMLYSVDPNEPIEEKKPAPGTLILEEKYPNIAFKSLQDIIRTFLTQDCHLPHDAHPTVAVLALAGVVMNNQCRFTNLDWILTGSELEKELKIGKVELINDFVAQGYGMLTLGSDEVTKLNDIEPQKNGAIACVGAGTGLGQCFLIADSKTGEYHCYPSEGQHGEFGPRGAGSDELQLELLKYLKIKFSGAGNRISVERVASGTGICNIYEFLAYKHPHDVDQEVHKQHLDRPKDGGIIAANAKPGSLCEKTLKLFASAYGAACGNFALYVQPFGGIYITGGVTKKLADWLLSEGSFLKAYYDKGRLTPLLQKVPLMIVDSDDMGQRGAHFRAVTLLKEEIRNQAQRLFDELDLNKNGRLNLTELQGLFQVAGSRVGPHNESMAKKLLEELDANRDGEVDFQEFLKGFNQISSKMVSESAFLHASSDEGPVMARAQLVSPPERGNDPESQADLAEVLRNYQSRSRRKHIDPFEDRNAPVFQTKLWKLLPDEDVSKEDSWRARQYWVNKMGCICYHSVTENTVLMYCTKKDMADATLEKVSLGKESCHQYCFRLHPRPRNGMVLAPTVFAAPSKEILECWLIELKALQKEAREQLAAGTLD